MHHAEARPISEKHNYGDIVCESQLCAKLFSPKCRDRNWAGGRRSCEVGIQLRFGHRGPVSGLLFEYEKDIILVNVHVVVGHLVGLELGTLCEDGLFAVASIHLKVRKLNEI